MADPMTRPTKVVIGSLEWEVTWDKKLANGTFGLCDASKFEIIISSSIKNEDIKRSTLLHELLHAACFNYGFNLPQGGKAKQEEAFVSFTSSAMYDILTTNKDVAAYILNKKFNAYFKSGGAK